MYCDTLIIVVLSISSYIFLYLNHSLIETQEQGGNVTTEFKTHFLGHYLINFNIQPKKLTILFIEQNDNA